MLKDTALYSAWSVAVIIKVIEEQSKTTFKEIATEHIAVNAILLAIIDFYSFKLPIELILVPIIFFITTLELYSRKKEENKAVNKFFKVVMKLIYVSLFAICIYKIIQEPTSLFSRDFINSLMLPIILTLLLLPYYYLLSLYAVYEQCFVILKGMSRGNADEYKFRRNTLLKRCGLNLKKLKLVKSNWRPALCETNDEFVKELEAVSNNKKISYDGE